MVFGILHIFDSVVFTKLSLGLLGSRIAAFCSGVIDDVLLLGPELYQNLEIRLMLI
jgi:hypothetical protein